MNGSRAPTHAKSGEESWRTLDEWTVASQPGNERQVIQRLEACLADCPLTPQRLEDLKTATAEATMNAMEHGHHYQAELPVIIQALASPTAVMVRITDSGGPFVISENQAPDLEAKLAGLQSPRGWGLFLIKNLVDDMRVSAEDGRHTVELTMSFEAVEAEGGDHGRQNP